ncbi:predicted protein [Botrytis cinerea T4]|uniref:Uncharacterized protein n=1 Tax=Botryotinia fuckeliana (strain T4) TaxID=999810 RepID=G2YTS6_BOTF4|nr:predicted protein [Botrytis cinerea T4]
MADEIGSSLQTSVVYVAVVVKQSPRMDSKDDPYFKAQYFIGLETFE